MSATAFVAMTTIAVMMALAVPVCIVIIPVVTIAAMRSAPAALPTIDIEELVPVQASIVLERRTGVPMAERLIVFQPPRHMVRSSCVDSTIRLIVRWRLVHVVYRLVCRGLGRVHQHEATGDYYCCHYIVHNVLRFVPVQLQTIRGHMNQA